jgi:hypothetical protein
MTNKLPSREQVIHSLAEKNLTSECSACRTDAGWLLPSKPGQPGSLQVMTMVDLDDSSQGFGFASLICNNCGHTMLFLLNALIPELNRPTAE